MNRRKIAKLKKISIKKYFSLFISLMLILNSVGHQFIDNKVFAGKKGLAGIDKNLSEVQKVQEVENEIVDNFEGLKFSFNTQNKTASVIDFEEGTETDKLSIPQCVNTENSGDFRVYKICSKAFEGRLDLQEITFPDTLEVIEENAFYGCENLKKVTFQKNSNLEYIYKNAFSYCLSLESVHFPNSLKSIGSESFQYCTNLKNVILPESIDLIEEKTFYNCSNLTKIDIPKSVICIKKEAFKKCFNLETINFLGFLETIKKGAFSRCESLKEVVLSGFVKTIGSEAFKCCKNLTKVILPDSVETIGSGIFECCTNLTDVILPKNADFVSITERAFCECIKLERISLPEQINTIKSFAFCQCDNLKTVDFSKIPVGIFNRVYLGDRSFYECKNLKIDEKDFCKFCQHESTFFGCNLECSSLRLPEMDFIIDREKQIVYIKKYKDTSLRYSMDGIFCIPENLRIDGRCFKVCGIKSGAFTLDLNFKTVFIPKTIESIEEEAFCNCSLVNVHCDNCDTLSIAKDAFKSCESLESVVFFNKGFCFNNETKEVFKFSELLEKKKSKYEKQHDENYGNSFQYPHGKLKLSLADKVETLDELKNIYIERYDFDFRVKDRPKHSHLFKHSPSALDVHQSCFGNCYFLASFASFLSIPGNAEKILKNIEDNNDGTVTIALFNKCGNKVFVKVSGEIPEAITEDGNLAVFNKREFTDWISLWFKAYVAASNCKAFEEFKKDICEKERINTKNMTYAHFNGGVPFFVFKYVFGFFNPTIIMTKDIISSPEEKIKVIKKIIESIQKKLPIVCGTNLEVKKEVLDGSHGYALINIKRGTKDRKFYLFLIDPRGRCLFERFPFEESLLNTSGLFYIEFEEFLKNFKILTFAEA